MSKHPPNRTDYSIADIFRILWNHRYAIICASAVGALLAFAISKTEARVFSATATVSIVTDMNSMGGNISSRLGGLASLAGIDLGSGGDSVRQEHFAYLHSKLLIRKFILQRNLMPAIFRTKWDENQKQWRPSAWSGPPTLEDGVEYFAKEVRGVIEDRKTGLVTVQIDWVNPTQAAEWANGLVDLANQDIRALAAADARKSIDYLNEELIRTSLLESRQAIFRLMETQLDRIMLASVRPQYAFRVIEPATRPDDRRYVSPQVPLQTGFGFIVGFSGAAIFVLLARKSARSIL